MAYWISKRADENTFEKGSGFSITITKKGSDAFSISIIELNNGRDPEDPQKRTAINDGYSAVYFVLEGEATFKMFEDEQLKEVALATHEYVHISPGTEFEIIGTCKLLLTSLPAYSDKMYSHPVISP